MRCPDKNQSDLLAVFLPRQVFDCALGVSLQHCYWIPVRGREQYCQIDSNQD
jgi:hypothetical protein